MKYKAWTLDLRSGDQVVVSLNRAANVFLVDAMNFAAFERGARFRYRGGFAARSPYVLGAPHAGRWVVVVQQVGLYAIHVEVEVRRRS